MENKTGMKVLFALLVALAVLLGLVVLTTSEFDTGHVEVC